MLYSHQMRMWTSCVWTLTMKSCQNNASWKASAQQELHVQPAARNRCRHGVNCSMGSWWVVKALSPSGSSEDCSSSAGGWWRLFHLLLVVKALLYLPVGSVGPCLLVHSGIFSLIPALLCLLVGVKAQVIRLISISWCVLKALLNLLWAAFVYLLWAVKANLFFMILKTSLFSGLFYLLVRSEGSLLSSGRSVMKASVPLVYSEGSSHLSPGGQ